MLFENDVKMYGTQTALVVVMQFVEFENDVKMYGTQTSCKSICGNLKFENDVNKKYFR